MGFSRQEYWSGLPFPSPGSLPNQGSNPCLLHWQVDSLPLSHLESENDCMSNSLQPHGLYSAWNSPGQNTRVVSLSLLQGIFPTQGSNPGLPHCRWVLYQLSHKGIPRLLEWEPSPSPVIFPTQELNWGLLHCRQILYQLSYQGSHRRL